MGYAGRITCRAPFIDDFIVFAIFLAVRSPQQPTSFLNRQHRTGTCRWHIRSGRCMVSEIAIHPYDSRSCFANPDTATYSATFHKWVSNVSLGDLARHVSLKRALDV
jgi:hypothetical protein